MPMAVFQGRRGGLSVKSSLFLYRWVVCFQSTYQKNGNGFMQKTLTAKPGMPLLVFLILGIVVLQSSFTPAHSGKRPVARIFSDTSSSAHVSSYFSISKK